MKQGLSKVDVISSEYCWTRTSLTAPQPRPNPIPVIAKPFSSLAVTDTRPTSTGLTRLVGDLDELVKSGEQLLGLPEPGHSSGVEPV